MDKELLIPKEKRKIKRYTWSEESLRAALEAVKYNGASIREASDKYGIPSKTLRRRLETGVWTKYSKGQSTALLGVENEKELADYIISLESTGYIHSRQEMRKIAYDFAKKKGLEHLFDQNTLTAGAYWLEGFLKRYPAIKVKEKLKKSGVYHDDNGEENDNVEQNDDVEDNDNIDGNDIVKHENEYIDNFDEDQNANCSNDDEEIYQSFEYKSDDLSSITSNLSQNKNTKKHSNNIGNSKDTGFRLHYEDNVSEEERKFYLKAYPSVDSVVKRRIHCTVCDDHIGTAPCQESIIRMHPVLKVTHCKKCHDFYNSGEFSKGEDGSELYCRWCGQGGEVYCCSKCPYVFCKNCIILNLTQNVVEDIEENENWNCFVCAPKIMWHLRAQHWALMNFIEKQKMLISSRNLSDSEARKLMTRDQSTWCCGQKVQQSSSKRSSSSAKGSVSGNTSDTSHEEITFRKRKSDKKYQRILPKTEIDSDNSDDEQQQPPEKKQKSSNNNDEVVCTPDVLSMLDNDNSPTNIPQKNTNGQKNTNVQKSTTAQKSTSSQKIATVQTKQPSGSQLSSQQKHTGALQQKLKTQSVQQQRQPNPQISAAKQIIINPNQSQQHVATASVQTKSQNPPPLIIRNYAAPVRGITPTVVTRKTIVGPRLPTSTSGQNPVYHTINGFRIDLNSAAQHETFRLPNGKLIQVKRQNAVPSTQPQIMNSSSNNQTIRNVQRAIIQPAQAILTSQGNQTIQHIALQQPPPQLATIRYSTRPSQAGIPGNSSSPATITATLPQGGTVLLNGATVQQVTAAAAAAAAAARPSTTVTTVATPSTTAPPLTRRFFSATPLGQARSQLQSQIFITMEICQYLSGKIQSLTNSNAYNSVKNYTDVNELYIHLSYLLTYAIARFKGIQDKCLEDMRKLGFSGNAESLQSGSLVDKNSNKGDDDDIEIVEPKTTCIDLDSDDEDASQSAAPKSTTAATNKNDQSANLKKELAELSDSVEKISDNDLNLAASFLAGMLEVELHEDGCDDESTRKSISPSGSTNSVNSSSSLKTPRKKTTNKPNPLLKQMELQELERIKETDIKLKSQCSIILEKLNEVEFKKLIKKADSEFDEDKKADREKEEIKDEGNKVNKKDEKVDDSDKLNTENKIVNNEKHENNHNETESKHEKSQEIVNNEILNDEKVQASIDSEKPSQSPSPSTTTPPLSESINELEIENKNSDEKEEIHQINELEIENKNSDEKEEIHQINELDIENKNSDEKEEIHQINELDIESKNSDEKEEINLDSEFESGNLTKQDLDILLDPLCSTPKTSEFEELNENEKIKQHSNIDIATIADEVGEKTNKSNDFAPATDSIFDIDKQIAQDVITSVEDNKEIPFVESILNEENNSNQNENETINKVNEFNDDITMEDENNLHQQLHSVIPQISIDDNEEDIATTLTEIMNEKCGDEIDKVEIIAELEKEDNGNSVLDSIASLGCIDESSKTQDDSLFETISDATTLLESLSNAGSCSKFNDDEKNEFLTDNFLAEFSLDGMVSGSATNIMISDNIPCETDELNLS